METISSLRFDALAGYARAPFTLLAGDELGWYSEANEKVLGTIVRDRTDKDHVCIVMGRDRVGRYRAVHLSEWFDTIGRARTAMTEILPEWAMKDPTEFEQGDEPRQAMDFFRARHPDERLNPLFRKLVTQEQFSPARGIIEAMMYFFQDPDGNFVEQFQSTAFDSRLWELYLFALLAELRYNIDRSHPAPDYLCEGVLGKFFIEAVIAGPTIQGERSVETGMPKDPDELERYMANYLPIKFAGPLTNKLGRKYWQKPHVGGMPIVLAIADFHCPMSMTWSQTGLINYLYGCLHEWHHNERGELVIVPKPIAEHVWGAKTVPSGFFKLPDVEHISAVISSREATISKFNRIGLKAGFGSPRVRMIRKGKKYVDDPNRAEPEDFTADVNAANYQETWGEGLEVYHNPQAARPLNPEMLPGSTHHFFRGGQVVSYTHGAQPFGSITFIALDGQESRIAVEAPE